MANMVLRIAMMTAMLGWKLSGCWTLAPGLKWKLPVVDGDGDGDIGRPPAFVEDPLEAWVTNTSETMAHFKYNNTNNTMICHSLGPQVSLLHIHNVCYVVHIYLPNV